MAKNRLKWLDTEYFRADETLQPVLVNNNTIYYTLFNRHGYNYVFPSVWAVMEYAEKGTDSYLGTFETEEEMIDYLKTIGNE